MNKQFIKDADMALRNAHFQQSMALDPSLTEILASRRQQIESALFYTDGAHTFDDVAARVLTGKAYLFINADACAICEVVNFSRKKVFHVWLAAGSMEGILKLTPDAENAATQLGCSSLTLTGRKGFAKALTEHGWQQTHVSMERELPPRRAS